MNNLYEFADNLGIDADQVLENESSFAELFEDEYSDDSLDNYEDE